MLIYFTAENGVVILFVFMTNKIFVIFFIVSLGEKKIMTNNSLLPSSPVSFLQERGYRLF